MIRHLFVCLISLSLVACATGKKPIIPAPEEQAQPRRIPSSITEQNQFMSLANQSYLQQGKRYFQDGYYKKSMLLFLPLACDGNAEAQYAMGYMYYYGYGVAQDSDVGLFWIRRSADQGYLPAITALNLISRNKIAKPLDEDKSEI